MDSMANNAVTENGPAASELRCRCASLHHGLGLWPAAYKDVARTFVHHARAPLDFVIPTRAKCAAVLEAVQGRAFGGANAPSLTASARVGFSFEWVGAKKRAFRSNKETEVKING
jgi:hypothetical protein